MMDITKSKNKRQISIQRVSQQIIEKLRQLQDDSSLSEASLKEERFSLKQEEEKWMYAEMLYKKTQEQLRKKEQHYCKLVEEKQQLEFMLRSMKMELKILKNHLKQLQGTEEQYLQSERHVHDLRNALDAKEHELNVTSQKLQDLLVALSEANNTIKQLQEHIQRLETENGSLEATTNQQINKIATLQKDLQDSVSVLNQLEEVITGLQREKINLEEQLNQQVQKQPVLSVTAQGSHNIWEEELKSQSHFSELDREKKELVTQFENERKKVKKLVEFKQTIEIRLDQEMKRNIELQKKYNGIKTLLKTTKKKLKEHENGESSSQTRCHGDRKNKYSEIDPETGQLRKEKSFMCPLHLEGETPKRDDVIDLRQMQQYKKDIEEQAKQEVKKKLEEVNLFLQTQASSQETLEKIRAANNASLINQMESIIRDLESELSKLKSRLQECLLQNEAMQTELKKYKDLYLEELKRRKSLGSKLVWSNEKLAEVKIKLFHERHKSKSLLAYSFLSGSLSASPILEIGQLGNLGNNLALSRPCIPAGGFRNPTESPLASKRRVEAYLAEMQTELEKNIRRELDQAKTELDAEFGRVCPIGSFDGSSKNLNVEQDPVSKAAHEYLDVLNKNYML